MVHAGRRLARNEEPRWTRLSLSLSLGHKHLHHLGFCLLGLKAIQLLAGVDYKPVIGEGLR